MTSGSRPISDRLAAYRAAQPPRTDSRAAMPDNVSPGCTTYRAAGLAARTDTVATLTVSARMIPVRTATAADSRCGSQPGPGGTGSCPCHHDDQQGTAGEHHARGLRPHTHGMRSLSFHRDQRQALVARTPTTRTDQGRKGLKRAAPPAGKNARPASLRHDAPAAATPARQERSEQHRRQPCIPLPLPPPMLPAEPPPLPGPGALPGPDGNPGSADLGGSGTPPPPAPASDTGSQDPSTPPGIAAAPSTVAPAARSGPPAP